MAEKRKIEWQAPGPGIPSMVKNFDFSLLNLIFASVAAINNTFSAT